MDGIPTSIFIS